MGLADISGSLFALVLVVCVLLGTILAAAGFGYSRGYFRRHIAQPVFCLVCGAKIGWGRSACGICGAPKPTAIG